MLVITPATDIDDFRELTLFPDERMREWPIAALTLMKGDKGIEIENNRRYALLFAFRRVRDLNFSDVVAMDVYD